MYARRCADIQEKSEENVSKNEEKGGGDVLRAY